MALLFRYKMDADRHGQYLSTLLSETVPFRTEESLEYFERISLRLQNFVQQYRRKKGLS